jgi:hypothetical protein
MFNYLVAKSNAANINKACQYNRNNVHMTNGPAWFQTYWEPCVDCCKQRRIGRIGDGGKWVCVDFNLTETYAVSIGSNNDFSFETEMVQQLKLKRVYVFDHTSNPPVIPLSEIEFHKTMMTEPILFQKLGLLRTHGKRVSVLKIDCEGCEADLFSTRVLKELNLAQTQVLVELHWQMLPRKAISQMWYRLATYGIFPFHKEPNIQFSDGSCIEYAFMPPMALPIH